MKISLSLTNCKHFAHFFLHPLPPPSTHTVFSLNNLRLWKVTCRRHNIFSPLNTAACNSKEKAFSYTIMLPLSCPRNPPFCTIILTNIRFTDFSPPTVPIMSLQLLGFLKCCFVYMLLFLSQDATEITHCTWLSCLFPPPPHRFIVGEFTWSKSHSVQVYDYKF